jgi:hypothetical protein
VLDNRFANVIDHHGAAFHGVLGNVRWKPVKIEASMRSVVHQCRRHPASRSSRGQADSLLLHFHWTALNVVYRAFVEKIQALDGATARRLETESKFSFV